MEMGKGFDLESLRFKKLKLQAFDNYKKIINTALDNVETEIDNLLHLIPISNEISKKVFNEGLTVYRTEKAHRVYKGQSLWGKGLYLGLYKDEVAKMTIDPESSSYQTPDIESVKTYKIPSGTKLKIFDFNRISKEKIPYGYLLEKEAINDGYDGIVILSDDLGGIGGNQVIIYNQDTINNILKLPR